MHTLPCVCLCYNRIMKKRIIVTGANGFAGGHLVGELKSRGGIEVIGVDYLPDTEHRALDVYFGADLVESWPEIETADAVIHLAGLAAVAPSFDHPQKYINFNSAMLTNLCEYYLKTEKRPRIVVISSGSVYSGDQKMPLTEGSRPGFSSPYVVSKITNENQVKYYKTRGLDIVTVRPFNHIGPNQGAGFILPDLYKKITEVKGNNL